MATPNFARFSVNASGPDDRKFEATNGQALALSLENPTPVLSVTYSTYDPGDPASPLATASAAAFLFSNGLRSIVKSPASTIENCSAPSIGSTGSAWLLRATAVIPGGVHVYERKIYVRNGRVGLVIPGETTQGGVRGWADEVTLATGTPPDVNVTETFSLSGTITPSTITGQQNDYNPSGLADATVLRLSSNAEQFITGIAGGAAGRVLRLLNVGSNPIGLASLHPSSAAGNQFQAVLGVASSFGEAIYLYPNESIDVWYDTTSTKWRFISRAKNVLGETTFGTGPMVADTHNLNRFQSNLIRLSANAGPFNLTGMGAGVDRMLVVIYNNGSNAFNIAHENAGSTAANRFNLPGGVAVSIPAGGSATFIYDGWSVGGLQRWILANPVAGVASVPVDLIAAETFALAGTVSPAQITANQNDYAPSGIADAIVVRLTSDADGRQITGIAGGTAGRVLVIENIGSFRLDLMPQNSSSTAANRIITPNLGGGTAGSWGVQAGDSAILVYDSTSSRWRILGAAAGVLGKMTFSGTLTADANNYVRNGASYVRIDANTSGPWKVTGLEAGFDREIVVITNVDAPGTGSDFRLTSEDAGSTAANRFTLPIPELIVRNGESIALIYDLTAARWKLFSQAAAAYPGVTNTYSLTADQNDLTFSAFLSVSSVLQVTPDANGRRITGIAATGVGLGREIILYNASSSFTFILQNESASSTAANRIALPYDQLIVPPNGSVRLFYATSGSRWRPATTETGPGFTKGANLTDADQTLQVSGGVDYQLPFGTLTTTRNKTLGNTSPVTGTVITIRRFDKTANTCLVKNHDGTTLFTFSASTPGEADFRFDGTNWVFAGYKPYQA